jgi:hypothetical protein
MRLFAETLFAELRGDKVKVWRNPRDKPHTSGAMKALALMQYARTLKAVQQAQQRRPRPTKDDLRAIFDALGPEGERTKILADLVERAAHQKPAAIAAEIVSSVLKVNVRTLLKKSPHVSALARYQWLAREVQPLPEET